MCERCSTPFCFIAQVYANLPHLSDFHRMLYLFGCISPDCIKRADSVKAFRGVIHYRNNHVTYANDEDYNYVFKKSDGQLKTSRLASMFDNVVSDDEGSDGSEEEKEGDEQMISTGDNQQYGKLGFKPTLKEYLLDTCEDNE